MLEREPEHRVSVGQLGVRPDRRPRAGDRLGEPALGTVDGCQRGVRVGQLRVVADGLLEAGGDEDFTVQDLNDVMRRDKKSVGGKLRFIIPTRLGAVELIDNVPEALVRDVLVGR